MSDMEVNTSCLEWVLVEWVDSSRSMEIVHSDFVNLPKEELYTGKDITVRDKKLTKPAKIIMCGDDYGFLLSQLKMLQEDYSSDEEDEDTNSCSELSTMQETITAESLDGISSLDNEIGPNRNDRVTPTSSGSTSHEIDKHDTQLTVKEFKKLMEYVERSKRRVARSTDAEHINDGTEQNCDKNKIRKLTTDQLPHEVNSCGTLTDGDHNDETRSEQEETEKLICSLADRIVTKYNLYMEKLNHLANTIDKLEVVENPRSVRLVTPEPLQIDASLEDIVTCYTKTEERNGVKTTEEMVAFGPGKTSLPKCIFENINWTTYTTATRYLLMKIFPRRTLATHSLTGKASPAFAHRPSKRQLDPVIVKDIVQLVSKKTKTPENIVRGVITTKCADENKMYRQRVAKNEKKKKLAQETKMMHEKSKNSGKENVAPLNPTATAQERPSVAPLQEANTQ